MIVGIIRGKPGPLLFTKVFTISHFPTLLFAFLLSYQFFLILSKKIVVSAPHFLLKLRQYYPCHTRQQQFNSFYKTFLILSLKNKVASHWACLASFRCTLFFLLFYKTFLILSTTDNWRGKKDLPFYSSSFFLAISRYLASCSFVKWKTFILEHLTFLVLTPLE